MDNITKADLDNVVNQLRIEWRTEIISQTRWLATTIIATTLAQFFAVMAGVYAMLNLVK